MLSYTANMETADQQRWRASADKQIEQGLQSGALVQPDAANPAHARIMGIVDKLSAEFGVSPAVYFTPPQGNTEEQLHHSRQQTLGGFLAQCPNNSLIIPESAHDFFTDGEIEAALAHEYDHLRSPELFGQKMSGLEQFAKAHTEWMRAKHQEAPPHVLEQLESQRNAAFDAVSEVATRFEVAADELAIASGRASDLIGALQKIMICSFVGEDMHLLSAQEVIQLCNDRYEQKRNANPEAAAGHSKETFVQRLERLEKAAAQNAGQSR